MANMMRPGMGKSINAAAAHQPNGGYAKPAGKMSNPVGNERSTSVPAAQSNKPSDGLKGAINHLRSMHPMGKEPVMARGKKMS